MDKRSYSVVLPAAVLYFVLLGFTDGQFFPGKAICLFYLWIFLNVYFSSVFCFFSAFLVISFEFHSVISVTALKWRI